MDRGYVDVVYARYLFAQRLIASGKYKIVYEVTGHPDFLWPLNNEHPNVLTVSKSLANAAPEVVVEYVKQTILSARFPQRARTRLVGKSSGRSGKPKAISVRQRRHLTRLRD